MSEKQATALIVGASLSGLMSALALAEANVKVIVLERTPEMQRRGAVLSVQSGNNDANAIAKKLRKIVSGGKRGLESWRAIQRRLREASEANLMIDIYHEATVIDLIQEADKVIVETLSGESFEADFVVGADGSSSHVRQVVNPEQPHAEFAGYLLWVGIVEEQEMPVEAWPTTYVSSFESLNGVNEDFLFGTIVPGMYDSMRRGERQVGIAWYDNGVNDLLNDTGAVENDVVKHTLYTSQLEEKVLERLRQRANHFPEPFNTAIHVAIDKGYLVGTPISEYVPTCLVNQRLVLVGDAAHALTPMTAQGFNSALEDAAVLGTFMDECVNEKTTVQEALMQYEEERLPIVRRIVQSGKSFSKSYGKPGKIK